METALALAAIAGFAGLAYVLRGRDRAELHICFLQREFDTASGAVRGADLDVIRYRFERHGGGQGSAGLRTGWWYCRTRGPGWLLVIAQDDMVCLARCETRWVVREITEHQMRAALGDV